MFILDGVKEDNRLERFFYRGKLGFVEDNRKENF